MLNFFATGTMEPYRTRANIMPSPDDRPGTVRVNCGTGGVVRTSDRFSSTTNGGSKESKEPVEEAIPSKVKSALPLFEVRGNCRGCPSTFSHRSHHLCLSLLKDSSVLSSSWLPGRPLCFPLSPLLPLYRSSCFPSSPPFFLLLLLLLFLFVVLPFALSTTSDQIKLVSD